MTMSDKQLRELLLRKAFRMPSVQTMISRKSSITNAFVNAVIPVTAPGLAEIDAALQILGVDPDNVRCSYCGDVATEWDHLRPLVLNRRPTGYISEIANLVPACGKCNQSKGNKPWRDWMRSNAALSPSGRGKADVEDRFLRLDAFERWRHPVRIDFAAIVGQSDWEEYWGLCEDVIAELERSQIVANTIRDKVRAAITQVQGSDG